MAGKEDMAGALTALEVLFAGHGIVLVVVPFAPGGQALCVHNVVHEDALALLKTTAAAFEGRLGSACTNTQ